MSAIVVQNLITSFFEGGATNKILAAREIARFILLVRNWEIDFLKLQGKNDTETINNINVWANEFEHVYRVNMVNIMTLAGFGGYLKTRILLQEEMSKQLYLEIYTNTIRRLVNKDFTKASVLRNDLMIRIKKNWRQIYDEYDEFLIEAKGLGLTLQEINNKFLLKKIARDNISLRDSSGRLWRPSNYTSMYATTRSSEMTDDIFKADMEELNIDLVKVSSHGTTTPICIQHEGKTYSRFGKTIGVPQLPYPTPFHPRCKHGLLPTTLDDVNLNGIKKNNRKLDKKIAKASKKFTPAIMATIKKQEKYLVENRL
jgi:hypothetical protein